MTEIDATRYTLLATESLEALYEAVETLDADGTFDTDYHDGVLTVETDTGKTFVINRHEPSRQIWVSSPVSGAHYFRYDEASNTWQEKGSELHRLILNELSTLLPHA